MAPTPEPLLADGEPPPVSVYREGGAAPFVLTCDHAGRRVPARLGRLGLDEAEFDRHIAYDIGASAVSRTIADRLDAILIEQAYSRLVIDCNRPTGSESSMPTISESTPIPGNVGLSEGEREARIAALFRPYHAAIEAVLDRRKAEGRPSVLIAMHSFTPVFKGVARPWHIGTFYGRDGRLAATLVDALRLEDRFVVGDNEPYSASDATDYAIPVYGERRGLLHVGIELRQDLVTSPGGQADFADILARLLPTALAALGPTS